MHQHPHRRNLKTLGGLVTLAAFFIGILHVYPVLTGIDELNGLIGVCLGLFMSAQPAANLLNMILFDRAAQHWTSLKRSDILWMIANLLVLLAGLIVIIIGTKLFFRSWK